MRAIAPIADEILVGATNMTPETERILRQYPAQLVPAPNPLEYGFDSARNAVLERAQYDWILWLDTDEKLIEPSRIGKYLRANYFDAYSIRQHHHAVDTNFPPDMPVRLFRRIQRGGHIPKWYGKIHEHPEKAMNEGPGNVIVLTDVNISHPGYVTESIRRDRFARNLPLLDFDRKVYPERLLSKHMVCRDNMLMVSHALERNGGMLTPELRSLCEEVVDICQKHFIGKQRYTGVDTLVFYTQALGVLGRGIEAEVTLKLRRDGQEIVAPFKPYRFSTLEELKSELLLAVDAGKPLERHWW